MFFTKKKSALEEWKDCFMQVMKNQAKPMHQVTYWTLFIACGLTFVMGIVMGAAAGSYDLILQNPEIAHSSWLSKGFLVF
ncbi:hypothetical protein LAT59_02945 [Candidatus Gracilibacteria bacterium]|nr:hypothetical protein [Candidatus Gracilibacteria bacterium]